MKRRRGAPPDRARAARAARAADRRGATRGKHFTLSAAGRRRAGRRGRDGRRGAGQEPRRQHHQPRGARPHRRRGARPGARARDLRRAGRSTRSSSASAAASTARRATPRSTSRRSTRSRSATACAVKAAVLRQRLAQALTVPGVRPARQGAGAHHAARRSPQADLANKYPVLLVADRNALQAAPLQAAPAGQGVHGRRRRRRLRHAGRALPHPEQAGGSHLERARQRLGGRPGRHVGPAGAGQPAQGSLDGHLRRRRHPRHRRDLLAGQRRVARLPPHGDPGRDRALRPGRRSERRSTS